MKQQRTLGISLIITSLIAWIASGTLVLERLELFKDPTHIPTCDFGLFLSCSTIMKTAEAALFGFPNPFLGIVGFAITGTIGVILLLTAKHREQGLSILPRWFMIAIQLGVTAAMALVTFFWYTSVYTVMTLCPWCMVVWSMVIPMFLHITAYNAANGNLGGSLRGVGTKLLEWNWVAVIVIYVLVVTSILIRFQEYIF